MSRRFCALWFSFHYVPNLQIRIFQLKLEEPTAS